MDTLCSKTDIESQIIYNSAEEYIVRALDDAASRHPQEAEVINGVFVPTHYDVMDTILFNLEQKAYEFNY